MFCYRCGKENNNGDIICDECKAKFAEHGKEAPAEPVETPVEPAETPVEAQVETPVEAPENEKVDTGDVLSKYSTVNGGSDELKKEKEEAHEPTEAENVLSEYSSFMKGSPELAAEPEPQKPAEPPKVSQQQYAADKKKGFGKALAATIIGAIGYFIADFANALVELFSMGSSLSEVAQTPDVLSVIAIFCMVLAGVALIPGVLAVVFGAQSIGVYRRAIKELKAKPVPTFVLGLIGLILGCLALLFVIASVVGALELMEMASVMSWY